MSDYDHMTTSDAFTLIRLAITATSLIGTDRGDNPAYNTTAKMHAEDFLLWAWGVGHGKVHEFRYTIDVEDTLLKAFRIKRHRTCILENLLPHPQMLPVQPQGPDPFTTGQPFGELGIIFSSLAAGVQQVAEQCADTNKLVAEQNLREETQ